MEDLLLDFYSIVPGVSEELAQELYRLNEKLLTTIFLVTVVIGVGFSAFFYFNPFGFRKKFWAKKHWGMVLGGASMLSLSFATFACFQNRDYFRLSGFAEFTGLGIMSAILTALFFIVASWGFKPFGNAVTRYTPI